MERYFCVSDVHSFFKELITALDNTGFEKDNPEHILCVLGDLFDRGDETVQLFEFVKELQSKNRLIYIRGNHEDLLRDCVNEIRAGRIPSSHHFSNGTVKTICQFCGQNGWIMYDTTFRDKICETMQPILDFINENCVDYAEIGDCILTHGYVPPYFIKHPEEDWNNVDKKFLWEDARWLNGMQMWKDGYRIPNKTIICGHWNCSWGWSHIRQKRKEFPQKNRKDWEKSFEPFVDDGIVAIDACCAYSGKINCVVIDIEE